MKKIILIMVALFALVAKAEPGKVEVGFSPEGSAAALVLKVIDSAHNTIRMSGYSFSSPAIVSALIAAQHRGVKVQIVLDERENSGEDNYKARNSMDRVTKAGVMVRLNNAYNIHHDKFMIIDDVTVETGSFNFTLSAERYNSENLLVLWNDAPIAHAYLDHWQVRWDQGRDYSELRSTVHHDSDHDDRRTVQK